MPKLSKANYYQSALFLSNLGNDDHAAVLVIGEISGGRCVASDVSTAAAAFIKANDARGVAVTSA